MASKSSTNKNPPAHALAFLRMLNSGKWPATRKIWIKRGLIGIGLLVILALLRVDILDTRFYGAHNQSHLLNPHRPLVQEFEVRGRLRRLAVKFCNYDTPLKGKLQVRIQRKKQIVYAIEITGEKILTNGYTNIPVSGRVPRGKYRMLLNYSPASRSEHLSVWLSRKNRYPKGGLWMKGKLYPGDMLFRVYYRAGIWLSMRVFTERFHYFPAWVLWVLFGLILALGSLVLERLLCHPN